MKKGEKEEQQKRVTIKLWDDQRVEDCRRRLEKDRFEEQEVEKMAEVTEQRQKKDVIVNGAKGTRKKNEW
jgi:hypothetical protein